MRTLTVHTADELLARWKRRACELMVADTKPGAFEEGVAHGYRICAAELMALVAVSMELEATHHGDPEPNRWPGFCRECGRDADHRWHTEQGPGFLGDGQVPHPYAP